MSEGTNRAPRHPRIEQRSLVLWTGYRSGVDVASLERDVVGAIAMPLRYAAAHRGLIASARAAGLGIVLPGQAYLNQVALVLRGSTGFAGLPYAQAQPIAVESNQMSSSALVDYAEQFLDPQLAAGATLATTPSHVFDAELGRGREQDVALAQASVEVWRDRQGWRPPPQRPEDPPRELYAGIAVRGRNLAAAVDGLIELYAPLEVSGYWVTVFDAGNSGAQLAAVTELALGLQEATGRPVSVAGVAAMHEALLASGVAATCAGFQGMRPSFPPELIDADEVTGIAVQVFHPAILGVVPLGARYERARGWLFANRPCACDQHPAHEPPRGRSATIAHNTWCLAGEARDATRLTPVLDERRLAARIERANAVRARLSLRRLPPGWGAVAAVARARRAGGSAAGEISS